MRSITAASRRARVALLLPSLALGLGLALAGCSAGPRASAGLESVEWIDAELSPTAPGALEGKALVVEFWATWCGPCLGSTPHLVELANEHADEGLVVLGVHVAKGLQRDEVDRFVERFEIPYAIGLDRSGAFASANGVSGIPDAFVYDRDGDLVWRGHPMDPAFDQAVARALE